MSPADRLTELRDILADAKIDREAAGQRWAQAVEEKRKAERALEEAEYALEDAHHDLIEAEDDLDAADAALIEAEDAVEAAEKEAT